MRCLGYRKPRGTAAGDGERIVRQHLGWQLTTLRCERLVPLLMAQPIGFVIPLDPLTPFFDEAVTRKEARLLFQTLPFGPVATLLAVHSQRPSHELFPHGVVPKILKAYV